jgi:hypothetical protein
MSRTHCNNDCEWDPIAGGIAEGKMRHYLNAAHQDKKIAIEMFHLDGAVAASFLEPIRLVELVLREAIHRNMTNVYGSRWMFNSEIIDGLSFEKVTRTLKRLGNTTSSDKIVSDLNLGFWAGLFQRGGPGVTDPHVQIKHSSTLWIPALSDVFRGGSPSRKTAATLSLRVSYLRNRIAHHEPILFGITQPGSRKNNQQIKQEPLSVYSDLIALASYLDVSLGELLTVRFRVKKLLENEVGLRATNHAKSHQNLYWI